MEKQGRGGGCKEPQREIELCELVCCLAVEVRSEKGVRECVAFVGDGGGGHSVELSLCQPAAAVIVSAIEDLTGDRLTVEGVTDFFSYSA